MTMPSPTAPAPFRPVRFMPRDVSLETREGGVRIMRCNWPLDPLVPHIPHYLHQWATARPDRTWLAERGRDGQWVRLSYGQAAAQVDRLTQALLDRNPTGAPVAILSGNSIAHALLSMAAMQAGQPAAPISPAYSLLSQDHAKLRFIFGLLRPGVVFVQDGPPFARALAALDLDGVTVVHRDRTADGIDSVSFAELLATAPGPAVAAAVARVDHDTVGKLLFTSGSTGMPKAVINTQRMMCANVAMTRQTRPRDPAEVPAVLDWLPWNHTMGGNASFNVVLADGGTFYIDDGRPVPGQFEASLRNLRDVNPTYYANVPAGYAALATALEHDEELCRGFFKNLGLLAYGGAALSDDLYDRMQALAVRTTGHRIVFFTGWGATETAPTATSTYWQTERVGLIGLPHPGVELKLVPRDDKFEVRLKGIIVTPGYYRQPDLTAAAFDEDGWYKIGDAARFVDPADPAAGLIFAGRVVEDFKLSSGTFVHVGPVRTDAIAAASPVIQDALVAGQDRAFIGLLVWPNLPACRALAGLGDVDAATVIAAPAVIARLRQGLIDHNAANPQSSTHVRRVLLMTEPPSIDGNEITDKGYVNQRAALERRRDLVERLYAEPLGDGVILLD